MNFDLKLEQKNRIMFAFNDNEFSVIDVDEGEPTLIYGDIIVDDEKIGHLLGYALINDDEFFYKCDNASGDCQVIASAICGKRGSVRKKYLSKGSEYEPIFILDQIEIEKSYRGKGIGSSIIKNLPKLLLYQFGYGSNIFLCASDYESADEYDFDSSEFKDGCQRLIRFYKRFGYKVIKDNVLVYNEIID